MRPDRESAGHSNFYAPAFDVFQCFQKLFLVRIALGQSERGDAAGSDQKSRNPQQTLPKGLDVDPSKFFGEIQMFEPDKQVVGKEDELEVREIGRPIFARNFADGASFLEFSDDQFCGGPTVVEFPNIDRQEAEIGDDDLIGVTLRFEQGQLPRRFFRDRTANDDESSGSLPTGKPENKRSSLQPGTVPTIAKAADSIFDRRHHFGDNGVGDSFSLEKIENSLIEEGRIGPNRYFSDVLGEFRARPFQERNSERSRMGIARQPLGLPCNTRLAFEAKQRRERGSAAFLRIVSDLGFLLIPVHRQHTCIEVENRRCHFRQASSHPIVKTEKPWNTIRPQSGQESAETGGIGIGSKAGQILKHAIVPEQTSHFDSAQPKKNRIDDRKVHFSERIPTVSLRPPQKPSQRHAQPQLLKESLEQNKAPEMCQGLSGKGDANFSTWFGHAILNQLKVSLRSHRHIHKPDPFFPLNFWPYHNKLVSIHA